jgi:nitrite reductase (NADH) small subunit
MSDNDRWIRIAYCEDIPLREGRAAKVGEREIAIFNLGDRFLAVENRCPHKSGPLADGIVVGATVVCPLHAWKLSLETGKGVSGPSALSCVETFPTRVEFGVVLISITGTNGNAEEASTREVHTVGMQANKICEMSNFSSAAEA